MHIRPGLRFTCILFSFSLVVAASQAHAAPCELVAGADTGSALSAEVLDEVSIIAGDVRPLVLTGRLFDMNGDGVREILALQGQNTLIIRDGASLAPITTGAFPFQLPNGAIPTQLAAIGDINGDNVPEIGVGLRYRGGVSGESAFVFSGASKSLIESFPSVIRNLHQKFSDMQPLYQNPPAVSRIGVSVEVADIAGARKVVYADPQVAGGLIIFRTTCLIDASYGPCYDVRGVHGSRSIVTHNLGSSMVGVDGPADASGRRIRKLILADPSADRLPIVFEGSSDVRMNLAGAVVIFSGDDFGNIVRGRRPNARFGFGLASATSALLGQTAIIVSAPSDGIVDSDTGEFEIRPSDLSGIALSQFTPGITEEGADLGYSVDGGDDLTSDGIADVVVGAPGEGNQGRVRVYTPGSDKRNRHVLEIDGNSIRFGQTVLSVGTGRLVVADAGGKLYALRLTGSNVGATTASVCSIPQPPATPTPNIGTSDNNELIDLKNRARSLSSLLGSLNFHQGRTRFNKPLLASIKKQTDRILAMLASPTVQMRESRLTKTFRADFKTRATRLQSRYVQGNNSQRRDTRKNLTSKSNQIVQWMSAAIAR